MKKTLSLLLALTLLLTLAMPALAAAGNAVPSWSAATLDGRTINQNTYSGKTQLLVFYRATLSDSGSGTCYNSNSLISELANSAWLGTSELQVIAFDVDNNSASAVSAYKQKYAPSDDKIVFALNGSSILWSFLGGGGSITLACCAVVQNGMVKSLWDGVSSAEECREALSELMTLDMSGVYVDALVTGTFCYNYARQQLDMINSFRTGAEAWYWNSDDSTKTSYAAGELGTLRLDANLEQIAMERARELALDYSHTRPNGSSCFSLRVNGVSSYGENIAYGYTTPAGVFQAWREDDDAYSGQGHRRNMLNAGYTAVGFGCFYHQGRYYWAQEFGYDYSGAAPAASDTEVTGYVQYSTDYLGENFWSDEGNCKMSDYNPAPPTVISLKANRASASTGETIIWSASASGGSGTLQYKFTIYKDGYLSPSGSSGAAVYEFDFSTESRLSFTPTEAGTYTAEVVVKDGAGNTDSCSSAGVTVTAAAAPITIGGVTPSQTSAVAGTKLTWAASASGGSGTLLYCFYVFRDGSVVSKGSYGAAKTYAYTPSAAGTYTVRLYVKDGAGTVKTLDNAGSVRVTTPITIGSVTPSQTSANAGTKLTWTASASGGSGSLRYCFYVFKDGTVVSRGDYGAAKTYAYTPSAAGTYTVRLYVKDAAGTVKTLDNAGSVTVTAAAAPITIGGVTPSQTSADTGTRITWTASASGGSGTLRYCFYVFRDGTVVSRGDYGSAKTYTYTPFTAGTYTVRLYVKDSSGTIRTLDNAGAVKVASYPSIDIMEADRSSASVGDTIKWTVIASIGTGTVRYCFYVYKDGSVVSKGSYGTALSFRYCPDSPGSYAVKGFIKDSTGNVASYMGPTVTVS